MFDLRNCIFHVNCCILTWFSCLTPYVPLFTSGVAHFTWFFTCKFHIACLTSLVACLTSLFACLTWIVTHLEERQKMKIFPSVSYFTSVLHVWPALLHLLHELLHGDVVFMFNLICCIFDLKCCMFYMTFLHLNFMLHVWPHLLHVLHRLLHVLNK